MSPVRRLLSPNTNAPGIFSAVSLAVAVAFVLLNHQWHPHQNPFDLKTITALGSSVAALLTRFTTTPIINPRNGAGEPLLTAWQHFAESTSLASGAYLYQKQAAPDGAYQYKQVVPHDAPDGGPADEPPLMSEST